MINFVINTSVCKCLLVDFCIIRQAFHSYLSLSFVQILIMLLTNLKCTLHYINMMNSYSFILLGEVSCVKNHKTLVNYVCFYRRDGSWHRLVELIRRTYVHTYVWTCVHICIILGVYIIRVLKICEFLYEKYKFAVCMKHNLRSPGKNFDLFFFSIAYTIISCYICTYESLLFYGTYYQNHGSAKPLSSLNCLVT